MAAGRPRAGARSAATPRRRPASSTRAATRGASASTRSPATSASRRTTSTGPSTAFSGGELTRASLARAARRRPRSPAPRRADEPPRRRQPRVAGARAAVDRRRRRPRRARPLVPRSGHERRPRARGRPIDLLRRALAQLAPRESGARLAAATTAASGIDVDIARLERFVERFRYKKSLAKRAQAKLTHIGRLQKERSELRRRDRAF